MTPEELYQTFSKNPCGFIGAPRQIDELKGNGAVFGTGPSYNSYGYIEYAQGNVPYWLARIVDISSFLYSPCIEPILSSAYDNNFHNYKLCLPFKFLQILDGGAYQESQSLPQCGVAHSFRNAVDTMRACHHIAKKGIGNSDFTRGATEHMTYWGWNSIPENLLMLGPDLVGSEIQSERFPTGTDMGCWPGSQGMPGAAHGCVACPGEERETCKSCGCCPPTGPPDDPCCNPGTPDWAERCCGYNRISAFNIAYFVPSQDAGESFGGDILTGRLDDKLYHVGILERKEYGGVCSLRNSSADRLKSIDNGLFFTYFQERNGWDYGNDDYEGMGPTPVTKSNPIERCRTAMPVMLPASVSSKGGMPQTDTDYGLKLIKQLLWNGEGVALFSNVGFPNVRDSQGLLYPDRIWYQMYSIIGYDDRCLEFEECVYVLHCPFGDWVSGGHPSWGPLPTGAFLVTESVLKEMIKYMNGSDYYGCRSRTCPDPSASPPPDCSDPFVRDEYLGCSAVPDYPNCLPYFCQPRQSAFGMLFAFSLDRDLTQDNYNDTLFKWEQFIPSWSTAELLKQSMAYTELPSVSDIDNAAGDGLSLEIQFIWNGSDENMYRERELINHVYVHSSEHQDIIVQDTSLKSRCQNRQPDDPVLNFTLDIKPYFGYIKIENKVPDNITKTTITGYGAFNG